MKSSILLAVFLLLPVQAQENAAKVSKLIEVKYADIHKLGILLPALAGKNTRIQIDPSAGTHYVAIAGPGEEVEAVERFIKKLDVPRPPEKKESYGSRLICLSIVLWKRKKFPKRIIFFVKLHYFPERNF